MKKKAKIIKRNQSERETRLILNYSDTSIIRNLETDFYLDFQSRIDPNVGIVQAKKRTYHPLRNVPSVQKHLVLNSVGEQEAFTTKNQRSDQKDHITRYY